MTVKGVISSLIKMVANSTVINGSANMNELVTAALTCFMTWNQMKYPSNEQVKARKSIADHS